MTEDSRATGAFGGDPEGDTADDRNADTASNTQQVQQPAEDWEARYKAAQAWATRESQQRRELENRLLTAQAQTTPAIDPADPLARERADLMAERQRLQQERDWVQIKAEKPPEVIDAYAEFQRSFALDPTPRGAVTAFENGIASFAQRLERHAAPAPPDLPTRSQATQPRVDTSRSDAPYPDEAKARIAGAQKNHDITEGVRALIGLPARR